MKVPLKIAGRKVPPEKIRPMHTTHVDLLQPESVRGLQASMLNNGYIHLKNVIPQHLIIKARHYILESLAGVGEISMPFEKAISTGTSRRHEKKGPLGPFWRDISRHDLVRRVTHGRELRLLMSAFYGERAHAYDFIWLRTVPPKKSFEMHCDYPFFKQRRDRIHSVWIPLGDVPLDLGSLYILKNTHNNPQLIKEAQSIGDVYPKPQDPLEFVTRNNTCFLASPLNMGDVIIFSMFTWHGSFDNTTEKTIRISCDMRFLPCSEPRDKRFIGATPAIRDCGHLPGGGYGSTGQWFSLDEL